MTCTRDDYGYSRAARKEKITRKFRLVDPKFNSYPDARVFSYWLTNMECY